MPLAPSVLPTPPTGPVAPAFPARSPLYLVVVTHQVAVRLALAGRFPEREIVQIRYRHARSVARRTQVLAAADRLARRRRATWLRDWFVVPVPGEPAVTPR